MACSEDAHRIVNVLISSFNGLGLPSTLALHLPADTSIEDLVLEIQQRIPEHVNKFTLTTNSNRGLSISQNPIQSLLSNSQDAFLPLRLSIPLCGGKGGFGSQLRAAGGRMSSKKKKNQGEANSSNRNLDGRRLRTINEAKALAEYLAVKPEMERREKEARRKRWEQVVELAERREEEARNGTKGRVDGKWVEDKEEAGERAREATIAAIISGNYQDNLTDTSLANPKISHSNEECEDDDMGEGSAFRSQAKVISKATSAQTRSYAGFDEDEEYLSNSSDDEERSGQEAESSNRTTEE